MPRTSASNKQLVAKYLREFPAELFRSDGDILYCTACDKRVSCSQRSQVTQHIATGSHIENKNRKKERTSYQAFLTSPSSSKSTLSTDLCRALVRADIPFHKLKNPHFKGFLETYIGKKMPDESALRKNYLEDIYKDTLTKIREHIKDGPIWVSIDETTDVEDDCIICNCDMQLNIGLLYWQHTNDIGRISGRNGAVVGCRTGGSWRINRDRAGRGRRRVEPARENPGPVQGWMWDTHPHNGEC
uniref:DUF659 domain-containing protein n=1 Tax=Rhodnius prolixus TaxID=13249 RepID=T1IDM3_RHOPR